MAASKVEPERGNPEIKWIWRLIILARGERSAVSLAFIALARLFELVARVIVTALCLFVKYC